MLSNNARLLSLMARRKFLARDTVRNSKIIAKVDRKIRQLNIKG